jgi:hypothetical protein
LSDVEAMTANAFVAFTALHYRCTVGSSLGRITRSAKHAILHAGSTVRVRADAAVPTHTESGTLACTSAYACTFTYACCSACTFYGCCSQDA